MDAELQARAAAFYNGLKSLEQTFGVTLEPTMETEGLNSVTALLRLGLRVVPLPDWKPMGLEGAQPREIAS